MISNEIRLSDLVLLLGNFPALVSVRAGDILKGLPLLASIDPEVLTEISFPMSIVNYKRGEVICRHGKFNDRFFLILSGSAKAVIPTPDDPGFELYSLEPGDFFGEEIIFTSLPRENSIIAQTDITVLSMDDESLKKIMDLSNDAKQEMDRVYIERKLSNELRRVPVFTHLDDSIFEQVLERVELISAETGRVVFRQGDEGDSFYLIRSGEVNVYMKRNDAETRIAILGEGQFFGEIALLSKEPRNATIETLKACELVKISRKNFIEIIEKDEKMLDEINFVMNERIRNHDNILANPNMALINRMYLDLNIAINKHLDIISQCTIDTNKGSALLATLPGSRYPYVYPRDSACASRLLYRLSCTELKSGDIAFRLLGEISRFIMNCQRSDGYWGQRYGINGEDRGIYKQEDNIAHGVSIICRYLLSASHRNVNVMNAEKYIDAIATGSEYARKNYYRNEIHLFYSTTSLHESAIERGYSIWVNYAYLLMFILIDEVADKYTLGSRFAEEKKLSGGFRTTIEKVFSLSDRYVRRIKPDGVVDLRPDITLLSPFFFGTGGRENTFCNNRHFSNSVNYIVDNLWDPDLGMLQRYLPFIEDPDTHIHAGNGPWVQYTAMLAQYYFYSGNIEKGNDIMKIIEGYFSGEGFLCEHLTTSERFYEFNRLEWIPGRDFDKEFDPSILVENITYNNIVEELNHMKKSYEEVEAQCRNNENGYISFATPLMWSHAEYAMALLMRTEKEVEKLS